MTKVTSRTLQATFAALAGLGFFMVDDVSPMTSGLFVTEAHAIIGRPATPMSYAGCRAPNDATRLRRAASAARRRRRPCLPGPGWVRSGVDAVGRMITQCY